MILKGLLRNVQGMELKGLKFASIGHTRYVDDFWARGFYCGTAGHVSAEQVARHIIENR